MNVLVVCTGNTCRSPLAEDIARRAARARSLPLGIESAGVEVAGGAPCTSLARAVARRHGGDLEAHRSQPVTRDLVDRADLVLVMTVEHVAAVESLGGEGKTRVLGVADPFAEGTRAAYERAYGELETALEPLLARLERETAAA